MQFLFKLLRVFTWVGCVKLLEDKKKGNKTELNHFEHNYCSYLIT
jgi:hypothetical protein